MPTFAAGHGAARLKASPSPRFTQTDPPAPPQSRRKSNPPPAPPQSRRKSNPPLAPLARSSTSSRPRNPRQPSCRRQFPIDQTTRTIEYKRPAVSSPEACPTPAACVRRRHLVTAGVRQPLTKSDIRRHIRYAILAINWLLKECSSLSSLLKKASLTGFHPTAKHIAAKAVSPSSETMRTI